jgi:hypothetical protein
MMSHNVHNIGDAMKERGRTVEKRDRYRGD